MLTLGERRQPGDWRPPIVKTVAARGEGVDEVVESLDKHRGWLEESGELRAAAAAAGRRRGRGDRAHGAAGPDGRPARRRTAAAGLDELAAEVVAGRTDPYAAADRLVEGLTGED